MLSSAVEPEEPRRAIKTVLIVEDEQTSRRALTLLLKACGYQTQAFASAEEALESLRGVTLPKVAFIDLDLPGMNGLDLISRLKLLSSSIMPILMTGADLDTLSARLKDRSVTCLRKPINFEFLLSLLGEERQRS